MKFDPKDFPTPDTLWRHMVSYGETDRMGYGYYGHFLHWFECARSRLIRERGMSYREVEERGIILPVREAHVRYLAPCRYDEEIAVRTGIAEWGRASVLFAYQVYGPPDASTPLAYGSTQHACADRTGKPVRVPAWLRDMF